MSIFFGPLEPASGSTLNLYPIIFLLFSNCIIFLSVFGVTEYVPIVS